MTRQPHLASSMDPHFPFAFAEVRLAHAVRDEFGTAAADRCSRTADGAGYAEGQGFHHELAQLAGGGTLLGAFICADGRRRTGCSCLWTTTTRRSPSASRPARATSSRRRGIKRRWIRRAAAWRSEERSRNGAVSLTGWAACVSSWAHQGPRFRAAEAEPDRKSYRAFDRTV